ncbi:MAG: RNA 2',3'-cyclic phosphodiesterase [Oceanospirillales bacterium]|uniref:RNA 2',3'-cyclic phosphodiesterase n=1 Tax=Marinobacterium halophilum TaxID=267374 RepID=A0A2P8EYT1_9GAMM|nr:RNA 2',3'-cyclic phosphodiesterase [Marinobacterium halophilum]MBR9827252.1 RNA 2',3'-cyclic phosphodiesterase [Oceanospirillales bacterium]PSL14626.1 2'-5' RNA ligase [Marinobacterium halophilum]
MKIRTFFALPIPERVARPLSDCADTLCEFDRGLDAHWVDSSNYHLTLCFLGDVTLEQVTELEQLSREELADQPGFMVPLDHLGYYRANPRLAVLAALTSDHAPLNALHERMVNIAKKAGIRYDERDFKPHVTLARLPAKNRFEVPECWPQPGLTTPADSVVLYQSRPGERGSIYAPLFDVHLSA